MKNAYSAQCETQNTLVEDAFPSTPTMSSIYFMKMPEKEIH